MLIFFELWPTQLTVAPSPSKAQVYTLNFSADRPLNQIKNTMDCTTLNESNDGDSIMLEARPDGVRPDNHTGSIQKGFITMIIL